MALRKQPDRRVKKKCKLEMQENLEITERKQKLADSRNFDLVENLLLQFHEFLKEIKRLFEFCRQTRLICVRAQDLLKC